MSVTRNGAFSTNSERADHLSGYVLQPGRAPGGVSQINISRDGSFLY